MYYIKLISMRLCTLVIVVPVLCVAMVLKALAAGFEALVDALAKGVDAIFVDRPELAMLPKDFQELLIAHQKDQQVTKDNIDE
jgi:hypothetical protein